MIVPDAIEPVVGWRCFNIVNRTLVSPQQKMRWPAGQKAVAACGIFKPSFAWCLVTTAEREAAELQAEREGYTAVKGHFVRFLMPDGEIVKVDVYMPWGMPNFVHPITSYPPEGMEWVLHREATDGHVSPAEGCNCGIHIAKDVDLAMGYMGNAPATALGRVKGWGTVIEGTQGWKVQFAYPEKLYLLQPPVDGRDLSAYGVEVAPIVDCDEYFDYLGITWKG